MIKNFFIKKENIFILSVALVCIFFVVLGFLFLFLKTTTNGGPKVIPNSVTPITWQIFKSDTLNQKIKYPEYMYILEQKKETGVGVMLTEVETEDFLTYFSNQNYIAMYPNGLDLNLYYAKTKDFDFISETGDEYIKTEYLTKDGEIWALKFVPKITPKSWQKWGFVWVQTRVRDENKICLNKNNEDTHTSICDPTKNQKIMYEGKVEGKFLDKGYQIINNNSFK